MPCCVCGRIGVDVHHLTSGGRRLGHYHTIPLCPEHHRFGKTSIASGRKNFERHHGSELSHLEKIWKEINFDIDI